MSLEGNLIKEDVLKQVTTTLVLTVAEDNARETKDKEISGG